MRIIKHGKYTQYILPTRWKMLMIKHKVYVVYHTHNIYFQQSSFKDLDETIYIEIKKAQPLFGVSPVQMSLSYYTDVI